MSKINCDVSKLTTIPEKALDKLNDKILYSICEEVAENILQDKSITELDFGLYKLYIKHDDPSQVKFKVVPSEELQKEVINTITKRRNLLEDTLNNALVKKFLEVYKDIC